MNKATGLLLFGGAVLGGGYLMTRGGGGSSSSGSSSSGSSRSGASGSVPSWTPGPGNEGRIYGSPTVDLPGAFYSGNGILIAPSCGWVVEGDQFLPVGDAMTFPRASASSLASSITMPNSTAWAYVKKLVEIDKLSAADAARQIEADARALTPVVYALMGAIIGAGNCPASPTPALASWLADVTARIEQWKSRSVSLSTTLGSLPPLTRSSR